MKGEVHQHKAKWRRVFWVRSAPAPLALKFEVLIQ